MVPVSLEYAALIGQLVQVRPLVVAVLLLLMLTGYRQTETMDLRWDDMDRVSRELRLRDTKTESCAVPLTPAIAAALDRIPCNGVPGYSRASVRRIATKR